MKILIVQTAFIGDVVLATPLIEAADMSFSGAEIHFLTIPYSAPVLKNNPKLERILTFEKRGGKGWGNSLKMVRQLKAEGYEIALVPHRSLRSAGMVRLAGIPRRIGFNTSSGRWLFSETVEYRKDLHEVKRNLSLLEMEEREIAPRIYPGEAERTEAERLLEEFGITDDFIAIAPGSIWETKRWLAEHYRSLIGLMREGGYPPVILIGGNGDVELCGEIAAGYSDYAFIAAGRLEPLASGALMARARLTISNDSAAGHLSAAAGGRVLAIFGATSPAFGFAPYGEGHIILEHPSLYCRPCRIHGSRRCPEKHFRCMKELSPEMVLEKIENALK